jgi:hypothetical protein
MNPWITAFVAAATPVAILAVGAAIARSVWRHVLDRNIESFKQNLTSLTSQESERFRHSLELVATEHQIRFSRFHERRAEVIAELYAKLVEASWQMGRFVSWIDYEGDPTKGQKYVDAMNATADAFRFFDRNRLFLSAKAADLIDSLTAEMRSAMIAFGVHVQLEERERHDVGRDEKMQAWKKAHEFFERDLPQLRKELESELQHLLIGRKEGA